MTTAPPRIPADVVDEFDVKADPGERGGWTMVFGSNPDTGVAGEAWSKSGPCLEALAGAYADLQGDGEYAAMRAAVKAAREAAVQ